MSLSNLFSLTGKVALVTGGYGHLGRKIAEGLLEAGAKVYILGRDEEKFNAAFQNFSPSQIKFQTCDIADTNSVQESFKMVHATEDRIDVLVNNAFFSKGQKPDNLTDEEWATGIEGNLNSVYRCIREVIPYLKETKGNIINVSSMYGIVSPDFSIYEQSPAFLNPPHYGAAKAGVIQLTKYFACYLGKDKIRVNTVSPGPFPNENVQQDEVFLENLKSKTALNRIGEPNELKGAFVFLASEAASFVTGQNIIVDGGWTAW